MTSDYFLAETIQQIRQKNYMTTSESKGRFFYKTNRFESIRITNRIDSNRELECSIVWSLRVCETAAGPLLSLIDTGRTACAPWVLQSLRVVRTED